MFFVIFMFSSHDVNLSFGNDHGAGVAVAACAARWPIADVSEAEFGQEVASDLVSRSSIGVGLARSGEPPRCVFCDHVPNAELGAGKAGKHAGAGRDRRQCAPALIKSGPVMSLAWSASYRGNSRM